MPWQIPVIFRILFGNCIAPILIKRITTLPSRTRNLFWQYFFTTVFSVATALILQTDVWNHDTLVVMIIGAFNAFACYCQWRAVDISLSKTSLFTQGDDLITMCLGYLFLCETHYLTPLLLIGILLCVGSALFFSTTKAQSDRSGTAGGTPKNLRLMTWVAMYSVIWGVAVFSMRYFALEDMSLPNYIVAWYTGSLIGAVVIRLFGGKKEAGQKLKAREVLKILPLSITIWVSLMAVYWANTLAPITVLQPIAQVSEMIFPTAIGLWIFNEAQMLRTKEKVIFACGFAGGVMIIFGF